MGEDQSNTTLPKFTKYAVSSMQGLRPYMENAGAVILGVDGFKFTPFFDVYDDHGGANLELHCSHRFYIVLLKDEDHQNNLAKAMEHVLSRMDEHSQEYGEWRALTNPFHVGINLLCCLRTAPCVKGIPYMEGSRAHMALMGGNQISRIMLSSSQARGPVSRDARARWLLQEIVGIQLGDYHVNGMLLSLSRAFGDFNFKLNGDLLPAEQIVACSPDILTGVTVLRTICEGLLDDCLRLRDNLTVILFQFKPSSRLPTPPAPATMHPRVDPVDMLIKLGQGVMRISLQKTGTLLSDFDETAIGMVAPVDAVLWWILRSFTESSNCQRAMHLVYKLCGDLCGDISPELLGADGCSMINQRAISEIELIALKSCQLFQTCDNSESPGRLQSEGAAMKYSRLIFSPSTIDQMEVSNKAFICLDESEDKSEDKCLRSVQHGIAGIRAWCFKYGLRFDASSIYGLNFVVFTTPPGGTFYIIVKYLGRCLKLLFEGRGLYFRGWRGGIHGDFEIAMESGTQYMHGDVTVLHIQENYRFLSTNENVGETRLGPQALRDAFEVLYKCDGKRTRELKEAIGIIAVHFSEPARLQKIKNTESKSFLTGEPATLDGEPTTDVEDENSFWVENYAHYCTEGMNDLESRIAGIAPPAIKNRDGADIKTAVEIFREIRIIHRNACTEGANEEKPELVEDPDDRQNKTLISMDKTETKRSRRRQDRLAKAKKFLQDESSLGEEDVECPLFSHLLDDWFSEPEPDQELQEQQKEEVEPESKPDQELQEGKTEEHELEDRREPEGDHQPSESKEKRELHVPSGAPTHEDFLSHSPAVRKFIKCRQDQELQGQQKDEVELDAKPDQELQKQITEELELQDRREPEGDHQPFESEVKRELHVPSGDPTNEDFLSHFPAVRKFIKCRQDQRRTVQQTSNRLSVLLSSVERSLPEIARITSTSRGPLSAPRLHLLQRPQRALVQPIAMRAGLFISRIFRFMH